MDGSSDRELVDVHTQEVVATIDGGFASHIAELDGANGEASIDCGLPTRRAHPFQVIEDGLSRPSRNWMSMQTVD